MLENIPNFDILKLDSGKVDLQAPRWLAGKLYSSLTGVDGDYDLTPEAETKLRIISDAIIAANLLQIGGLPAWAWNLDALLGSGWVLSDLQLEELRTGIKYMRLENWLVAMLPEISSFHHAEEVAQSLNSLQHACNGSVHWVMDLAGVSRLPAELIGYLIGFNHGLRLTGCHMALLWVRRGGVPEVLRPPLIKHFSLVKKGAFFLSKGEVSF